MTAISYDNPPTGDNPRDSALDFEPALIAAVIGVRRLLRKAPPVVRPLTAHLSKAAGKMLRARSLLVCAEAGDGKINPDAVRAASAVELLHLATLVHDDIIDNASKRRGIDALHRLFGEKAAVLCGDYLFCAALDLASEIRPVEERKDAVDRTLPHYLTEICLGELRQNGNAYNYALSEKEYFRIVGGKTAALFEASFFAGFLFSDEPDGAGDIYKKIGNTVGVLFQLADDCADYELSETRARKPVLSDFSRGVVTLPLIHALRQDPALRGRIEAGIPPEELRDAVAASGGLSYAHAKITGFTKKAAALTGRLGAPAGKRSGLLALIARAAGQ